MRQDLFEDLAHLERVAVALVVIDVPPGQRRLIQMPAQDLLVQRQCLKTVRVILHDRGVVYLLQKVPAFHQISIFS